MLQKFKKFVAKFGKDEGGATMVEYTILAGLVSIIAIATITLVGGKVAAIWTAINTAMPAT